MNKVNTMNPEAPMNHVQTSLPLNEWQDTLIKSAVEKSGEKSIKAFIRNAAISRALRTHGMQE